MGGVPMSVRFEGLPARGCVKERRAAVTSGQQIQGIAGWPFRPFRAGAPAAAVVERNRRIVAVLQDCERVAAFGGPAGSVAGVSGHDVGDIRRPRCGPGQSQAYPAAREARASRISSARSRVLLAVDAERVGRLVGRRVRLMIRRLVRVESDPSSTGASHLRRRLGACSHRPIAWRSPGVGESGCRDPLAPTCDAVVNMM